MELFDTHFVWFGQILAVSGMKTLVISHRCVLDQVAYENKARGVKGVKIKTFYRCNEGTIDDGPVKNPNRAGCNVIETIRVLKFPQVQSSLQLVRKGALDQVAYENEARGLKILKILGFSRCNEGTIGDGAVNNPNPTGCNVIETISVLKISSSSRLTAARKKGCTRSNSK